MADVHADVQGFDFHGFDLPRMNTDEHGFFATAKTGARLCPQDQSQHVDYG
jgi:hypothetical protein